MFYLHKSILRALLGAALAGALLSCSTVSIEHYSANQPRLILEKFFDGQLTAHGVVKNRGGKVIRYFNATIDASWDQNGIGTLDERFVFDDGEQQTRLWTLIPQEDGAFTATANDVTGTAKGQAKGNSVFMDYVLQVPYNGSVIDVSVDDRMYLVDDTTLINESQMTKFGFKVGLVLLTIIKH